MRRFLSNLVRNFRTAKTARPAHRLPRRTMLQLESLEDRLVPTTVSLSGSTLTVSHIGQNDVITFKGYGNDGMQVQDNGQTVYANTNKQSISTVRVGNANFAVSVDDSNGMPFAYNTTVYLSAGNQLDLGGSRAVSGNELYVAGAAPGTSGMIQLDNITFNLASGLPIVFDYLPITGTFDVQTSGLSVVEDYNSYLSGLGSGGGSYLYYGSKPHVVLDEFSAGASVSTSFFGGTAGSLEQSFAINLHGTGDSVYINGTPSNVTTSVNTFIAPVANQADVYVAANTGTVVVNGNSSTYVALGGEQSNGGYSAQGIQGAVIVNGVGDLSILDTGNTAQESVLVTPQTISGSGLFGNSNVIVWYSQVGSVYIDSGTAVDAYQIETSSTYPKFSSTINIDDNSTTKFVAVVDVDPSSNLNLHLFNDATPEAEALLFLAPQVGESISISTPSGNGVAKVIDANGAIAGTVFYQGRGWSVKQIL